MLQLGEVASVVESLALRGTEPFLFREDGQRQFRQTLVGAQRAEHPVWARLQNLISGHLCPVEGYRRARGGADGEISVVSVFVAWDLATLGDAEAAKDVPPASWYVAKANFNALVRKLHGDLRDRLAGQGVGLVHPMTDSLYERMTNDRGLKISNWSERHVAYACGLGCFGLHGGLITAAGSAGRLVSFLIGAGFDRYAEFPEDPFCHCLLLSEGTCGACIERCPVGAISGRGCDVLLCRQYVHSMHELVPEAQRHGATQACGFCMTGVPCASSLPRHDAP